jgi:pseudaminic acid biosynthesis-associated methylase
MEPSDIWCGEFGKQYTDRNSLTPMQYDALYRENLGVSLANMNDQFIGGLDRGIRILEVGANIGVKLLMLQRMGFRNLLGIELQRYAVEKAKYLVNGIDIIQGSALDIPFKDGQFDMVFTSGVLIHIAPADVSVVIDEMYRVSKKYVWGYEYYAPEVTEIEYRGQKGMLWKADFRRMFLENHPDLVTIMSQKYKYIDSDNVDEMFLLAK